MLLLGAIFQVLLQSAENKLRMENLLTNAVGEFSVRRERGTTYMRAVIGLTTARQAIMDQLEQRQWFRATDIGLQMQLAYLPMDGAENSDGFLRDLAARPEHIAGVTVLHMERLERGNFAYISVFRVANDAGTEYTYEYVSWRQGPLSGAKGIVLITENGEITKFAVLRGAKFATGKIEWDTIGGFIDLDVDGVTSLPDRIVVEIKQELGLEDLRISTVHDLGFATIDAGMTNNRPRIFAAVIDGSEAQRVPVYPDNPDEFELRSGVVVLPIENFLSHAEDNTDTFFRSVAMALLAKGIIDVRKLVN